MTPSEQIKERLDIVSVIKSYLELKPAGRNFKALCPFHEEKTPSFIISPDRQIWHCFGCFPPGQKIKTPFGFHNIETIDEKHLVYSGKGEIRKVLATHKRNYKGDLVDVLARKLGGVVSLTTDHKLRIIRPKTKHIRATKQFYRQCREFVEKRNADLSTAIERYGELLEISAGELKKDDFVFYPMNTRTTNVDNLNLKDYLAKSYTFGPRPSAIPYNQQLSDEFLKLLAYWIAEGSSHRAYIRFSLGNHEEDFAKEIVELLYKLFGLKATIHRRLKKERTGIEISACHAYLANIFENLCGKGAEQKHVPFILQEIDPARQKVLLESILKGDGYSFIANRSQKRHKVIKTISRVLAEQIVDILLRNNLFPALGIEKARKDKIRVNHKEAYTITWSEEAKSQHHFLYQDNSQITYWLLPVKSVIRRPYIGPVYNLTVEKDHSYIATNFAVANCGVGGDIFNFLMRYENLEFHEALAILAEKAGVELKRLSPADERQFGILHDINNTAASIFEENLTNSPEILSYLEERGLKPETIKTFDLGLAPTGSDNLTVNLINRGFNINDIVRAGLAVKTEKGQYRDRFQRRIIFPIHNHFGKIVGFSGRVLPQFEKEDIAKYLNTPETSIFNKSRLLYGFWQSKKFIREEEAAFLVEGQMDFLLSWQDGVKNVVASSGTALTADHLRVLRRSASKLILGFDLDEAGQMAAERSIDLAGNHDFTVSIASLGEFSDPAEAAGQAPGFLKEAINEAKPAMEHYFNRYLTTDNLTTLDERKKTLRLILSKIKHIWSPVERSHWLRELSHQAAVPERELRAEMDKLGEENKSPTVSEEVRGEARKLTRIELVILQILGLIVLKKDLAQLVEPHLGIIPSPYGAAYNFIVSAPAAGLEEQSTDPKVLEIVNFASLRSGIEFVNFEEEQLGVELKNLLRELQYEHLKQLRDTTGRLVLQAEQSGNEAEVIERLKQLDEIVKKLHNLKNAKEESQKVHT